MVEHNRDAVPAEPGLHVVIAVQRGFFNWDDSAEDQGDFTPGADSQEFDSLTRKADIEQDQATRNDLYKQAEELVLKNAVCVPLGNWVQQFVQKPYIQGTKQGPWTGRIPVWFDKDVSLPSSETTSKTHWN